ncbi:HR1 rho-binding repeat containing protein [Theileria orientalis strain Shintoku]|uniref:HR1 rho-binding repeat containing protein n=1 Tax=Theileria orientalis strain Shintoku TaxID=869250 RepID=J4C2Z6_THEOR|nr:HR1 rho-binding repeat containing protein [Theileria orientalis strain Shintoku]BAM39556.1 HR1 rho-binding repeat containing protein [Theileria orientalis strain Shintoku]|eukprot:XP_009689857.1 HR1 rho-binding repeat containing protein [Theileria orientalis strain Shintoku]
MIRPSIVSNILKDSNLEENTHKHSKRPLEIFYYNNSFEDVTTSLFYPSLSEQNELKLTKNVKKPKLTNSTLLLDLEYVKKHFTDTKFLITPSEIGLDYMDESLSLFEDCLNSLPNFKVIDNNVTDAVSYFNNLVESFFLYLENENVEMDYEQDNIEDFPKEDQNNLTSIEFNTKEDRPVMVQLFLSTILAYNWSLKLFEHTQTALEISKWNLSECETNKILEAALGLREANRNYVFYNTVSQTMLNVLKSRETMTNSFIVEFMERVVFLNKIATTEMSYEPLSWNRIRVNFSMPEQTVATDSKTEHEENLNMIRNEMAKRLSGRSKCEYLRREVENANAEMQQMESKNEEVLAKLEALKNQLSELPSTFKFESASVGKMTDSKKLPRKLFDLLTHLNNFAQSNPLREINFKVLKDHNYSFQMVILAPKDLLFPSLEATKFLFPLVFHFYLEEEKLRVKQVNSKMSTSKPVVELVMNRFLGTEEEEDLELGLEEFDDHLSEKFHDTMEKLYKQGKFVRVISTAQEFVWNLYVLESYKSNNKSILSKIMPKELQDRTTHSKYTFKEKNVWKLSNEAASATVQVENVNGTLKFQFTEFEKTGTLENIENSKLVDHLKQKNHEFDVESLAGMAENILDYFSSTRDLINTAVLFESYSVRAAYMKKLMYNVNKPIHITK